MKKSIIKKLFIRLSKILGYEIIDQNEFYSPTLEKKIDENLSSIDKSIVLPLGKVKLTRKVKSLLILFRTNTNIEIWDQNKRRIFEFPKIEYVLRSLNSLIKSINYLKEKNNNIEIKVKIIDDNWCLFEIDQTIAIKTKMTLPTTAKIPIVSANFGSPFIIPL